MAENLFQRYGIKEVADVSFYKIKADGTRGDLALYLDTLKVSTIEQTAEQTEARGGKGNPPLIIWDYGKEITLTIEDALFSPKSMQMMFGDMKSDVAETKEIQRSAYMTLAKGKTTITADEIAALFPSSQGVKASHIKTDSIKVYDGTGAIRGSTAATEDERVMVDYIMTPTNIQEIVISSSTFPGTYYVVGDTYARNETTGEDEFFQFVIPKAKMNSENTITLEAEGDPTVFNMSLRVMRPENGEMLKLIKYDFTEAPASARSPEGPMVAGGRSNLA